VFGVSPGLTPALIEAARASGLPLLPGVMTPSEVMAAREAGFRQLKLFPAVPAGGVGMLNAIAGPLPDVTFCPTGGISQQTAPQFLACPNVACVGGSWLTPKDAMEAGDWARITQLAAAASALRRPQ
jgi:2-dehydro-3-deoxyphosphogluconate aldolase/(4S)-4-hydroxy-2-oxoglutarate aldolase